MELSMTLPAGCEVRALQFDEGVDVEDVDAEGVDDEAADSFVAGLAAGVAGVEEPFVDEDSEELAEFDDEPSEEVDAELSAVAGTVAALLGAPPRLSVL